MSLIQFAVVGLGRIGLRHTAILSGHPACQVVAGCDIDEQAREEAASAHQIPVYESIEQMLQHEPGIEVVCICTPNGIHAQQALAGLNHQKHVVIEKPLGLTKSACEEVLHRSLQVNRQVFCVMQNRYSPPSAWLKQVVEDDLLGNLHMVQINCYWNRDERYYKPGSWKGSLALDGGPLFTQFSHFVDTLYWIFGDIEQVQARFENFTHGHNTEFEDSGSFSFKLKKGGALGLFSYTTACWDRNLESSLTVIGAKGSLKIGGQYMNEVVYCHIKDYELPELPPTNPPNHYGPYIGSAANHHYVIENVVNTLNGNSSISTNALEGLKVVEIIERVYQQRQLDEQLLAPTQSQAT